MAHPNSLNLPTTPINTAPCLPCASRITAYFGFAPPLRFPEAINSLAFFSNLLNLMNRDFLGHTLSPLKALPKSSAFTDWLAFAPAADTHTMTSERATPVNDSDNSTTKSGSNCVL